MHTAHINHTIRNKIEEATEKEKSQGKKRPMTAKMQRNKQVPAGS